MMYDSGGSQPIGDDEAIDPLEFANIIGDERRPDGEGVRRNQHVVRADRRTAPLKIGPQPPIMRIGIVAERQYGEQLQYGLQLCGQPGESPSLGAITQLARDDDAGRDIALANLGDVRRNHALRMPDEVRQDIRVEKEHRSEGNGIGGKIIDRTEIIVDRLQCL